MQHNRGRLPSGSPKLPTCRKEHKPSSQDHNGQSLRSIPAQFRSTWILAVATVGLFYGSSTLSAPSPFGSVRGIVQDTTSATIPGTTITLHSVDENSNRTLPADGSGNFDFENVKAGH